MKYNYFKKISVELRKSASNARELALDYGLLIKDEVAFFTDYGSLAPLQQQNAVLTVYNNRYIIYYKHGPYENFYILHELCHYLLKHTGDNAENERQANYLACMSLIPYKHIKRSSQFLSDEYGIPLDRVKEYKTYALKNIHTPLIVPVAVILITLLAVFTIIFCSKPTVHPNNNDIVYITKTGTKYHKQDCYYIKDKKTIALPLKDLEGKDYLPCNICFNTNEKSADSDTIRTP